MIFSTVFAPQEPALTVGSLAIRATRRPPIVPRPVTTPSAPRPSLSQLASRPSSEKRAGVEQPRDALADRQLALLGGLGVMALGAAGERPLRGLGEARRFSGLGGAQSSSVSFWSSVVGSSGSRDRRARRRARGSRLRRASGVGAARSSLVELLVGVELAAIDLDRGRRLLLDRLLATVLGGGLGVGDPGMALGDLGWAIGSLGERRGGRGCAPAARGPRGRGPRSTVRSRRRAAPGWRRARRACAASPAISCSIPAVRSSASRAARSSRSSASRIVSRACSSASARVCAASASAASRTLARLLVGAAARVSFA